jgi:hypothetical protein
MMMRIPTYIVAFAPSTDWQADNIVWRVPADHVDTLVRVLMFNGVARLEISLEGDGDA